MGEENMDNNLIEIIEKTDIPKLLKSYLLRNKHAHLYINEALLSEIEELYIEYDSLFIFDEAEFCSYVITGIKKQEKHDYFYHYLKKVFDTNLTCIPKSDILNYDELAKVQAKISALPENQIPRIIIDMFNCIDEFKNTKNVNFLFNAYEIKGVLRILFLLYPDNEYKNDYDNASNMLSNIEI